MTRSIEDPDVAAVFARFPEPARERLHALRNLIIEVASETERVGPIEETLKWGEPAYVTSETGAGTTIRISTYKKRADRYALYVHCQTSLVDGWRELFSEQLTFDGSRAVVLDAAEEPPEDVLRTCIAEALTYHLR